MRLINLRAWQAAGLAMIILAVFSPATSVLADDAAVYEISLKSHIFTPHEVRVPAGKPFALKLKNGDPTPAEFESRAMKFEKVVAGNAEIVVRVKALAAGTYEFFDEYREDTTKGRVIAE